VVVRVSALINVDIAAATEQGVIVMNTPDANATTTAELAIDI